MASFDYKGYADKVQQIQYDEGFPVREVCRQMDISYHSFVKFMNYKEGKNISFVIGVG